ncbi:sensor domain-containing protein [Neorhizobium lilium]|nr:diguanylate cyclase [Neorhizobium lilium]
MPEDSSREPLEELCSRLLRIATESEIDLDTARVNRELETRTLLDQLPDFIYVKDRRSRFVFANAAANRISRARLGSDLVGKTDFDLLDNETARRLFITEQEVMSSGVAINGLEERVRLPEGRILWLMTTKTPLRDASGQIVGLIGISRNITERKRQDDLRHGHARLLEMIARGQPLTAVLDALVRLVEAELDGIIASVLLLDETGERLMNGSSPNLPLAYVKLIDGFEIGPRRGSCGTAAWRREAVVVRDIQADPLWDENFRELALMFGFRSCWSSPLLGPDGRVLGTFALYSAAVREPTPLETELTAMATDIAGIAVERAHNEARIQHMAHHDPLTGLPNRAFFWAQFSRALHEAQRERRKVTVAYIDLDNFKTINDTLGHAAGDEILRSLAARMSNCIRASDLLARLGGDEFAVVFSNPGHDEIGVIRRLQQLRAEIARPVVLEGQSLVATCSMGVAFFPQDGETPEALLARADKAMYEAKGMGRNMLQISGRMAAEPRV